MPFNVTPYGARRKLLDAAQANVVSVGEGVSPRELAARLDRSYATVYTWLSRCGWKHTHWRVESPYGAHKHRPAWGMIMTRTQ